MVRLTRIYTRTGDDGTTSLGDLSRTGKTDPRLCAYADVDETNSALGVACALGGLDPAIVEVLRRVQNELFDLGADLATPLPDPADAPRLRVTAAAVERLEQLCDEWNAPLADLTSFILPGGTAGAALLHLARTICRRAERTTWQAMAEHGEQSVSTLPAVYLNRLSDLLFILARTANVGHGGDVLWRPGSA